MWVSRELFQTVLHERSEAQGAARALDQQVTTLKATQDWLIMRLTQLEYERAQLLETYLGVKVMVPKIESASRERTPVETLVNDPGELFKDVGDVEAERLGVGWNDAGEFVTTRKS